MKNNIYILLLISLIAITSSCKLLSRKGGNNKAGLNKEQLYQNSSIFTDASKEKILGNYQEAIELFALCIKNDPKNAAAYYEIASIYSHSNQYKEALVFAKNAANIDENNIWYHLLFAKLLQQNKDDIEAINIYKKINEKNPNNIEIIYELAMAYYDAGKYQQVVDTYDKLEQIIGLNAEVSIQKYKIYLELNKQDKAINEIQKLIDKFPNEAKYYGMLADYYMQFNKLDNAYRVYNKVLLIEPNNALIRLSLSNYYRVKGDSLKSIDNLKMAFANPSLDIDSKVKILYNYYIASEKQAYLTIEALDLSKILVSTHSDDPKSHSIYADFLYREANYNEAKEEYEKTLLLDSTKYVIWEQILFCNSELKNYKAMIDISMRAIELFPEQSLLYLMNGMGNYQLNKFDEAINSFKQGVFYVVDNNLLKSQFYSYLGDAYYKMNKMDSSDIAYDNSLIADPKNIEVLNNYSYYLSLRNVNLEKAETMAKKANTMKPNNSSYLDTYAWVLYKLGKYEEAKLKIDEAIKYGGVTNAVILEHKGDIAYKLGSLEEAYKYWEKANIAGKGSEFLEKKLKEHKLYE